MNAIVKFEPIQTEIKQIPYWDIDMVWKIAGPLVQKAIEVQDEWTLEGVYKELVSAAYSQRPMQLWMIGNEFALITQIQVFPSGIRKCLLFLGGGSNLQAINQGKTAVIEWAKKYHGCSKFLIYGRRGWLRALKGFGFEEKTVVMECDI